MKLRIELNEEMLKTLVIKHLREHLGDSFDPSHNPIKIEVRSKQNFKSEWEHAEFRAVYESYK